LLAARGTLRGVNPIEAAFTTVLLPGLACDAELWRPAGRLAAATRRVSDVHTRADSIAGIARRCWPIIPASWC
jgi:hypothetical protein